VIIKIAVRFFPVEYPCCWIAILQYRFEIFEIFFFSTEVLGLIL